ncbi:DegT/DnrJ/EryC1/StrS family aminotransferase [Streptomyces sp. NPDC048751]|uniref:DegT/DnrJ/EryC1/StrS family aminotransferase n=1 Tax=Streptomyces sp. NPDC048751 TaxID=3365591 RepID=UPI00371CD523
MSGIVPFADPCLGEAEVEAVTRVLRSNWIGTGAETAAAEAEFAEYLGVPHTLLLNSGTAALHLAMVSLGIGPGDEVIVPTVTFTATAAAVVHAGATPVLVDVEPGTLTVAPEAVRRAVGPRTKAVIAVHFAGRMADVRALRALCDERGLALVEDSAHALPAERDGTSVGRLADAAAFSFFVSKPLTSAEGGLLVSPSAETIRTARTLSAHGIDRDAFARHTGGPSPHYDVVAPGMKYNMPDTVSAMLRCQLEKADWMRERRRAVAEAYLRAFEDVPGLELPHPDSGADRSSWYLFAVLLPEGRDRDAVAARLRERGIGTSVHFRPLHHFSYYRRTWVGSADGFPVADAAFPRLLSLPVHPTLTDAQVELVISEFTDVVKASAS